MLKFYCQTYQVAQLPHIYSFISSEENHLSFVTSSCLVACILTSPFHAIVIVGVNEYIIDKITD